MFARMLNVFPSGVALAIAAAITLIVGSACKGPINSCDSCAFDTFAAVARSAMVVPPATDTTPRATVTFNTTSLAYAYIVTTQPAGTIDSIALYQAPSGDTLPSAATAILCAGAAACAARSGTAMVVVPATAATIRTSIRGYGTQLVFFTTAAQCGCRRRDAWDDVSESVQ